MTSTVGKVITCKAVVCWEQGAPLAIENIQVSIPKSDEVRIKITHSGVCHTDFLMQHHAPSECYPQVLGHEGAGVVESIGDAVTSVKIGDKVMPSYMSQCRKCGPCKSDKTNLCIHWSNPALPGLMADGTTAFSCREKPIKALMACGTFSEYVVSKEMNVCKIDDTAPLDKVCLLACGVTTGYGSAINTAKVEAGSTCAVWGLGTVGLAVGIGCKAAGASEIIGIDINSQKLEIASKFGFTKVINPLDLDEPIQKILHDMTNGGVDNTFECVGNTQTMRAAYESTSFMGTCVIIGAPPPGQLLEVDPYLLIPGRHITGSVYGKVKPLDNIPRLVDKFLAGELPLDLFITHNLPLEKVTDVEDMLKSGECIKAVLHL